MNDAEKRKERLIESLRREGYLKSPEIIRAFRETPRELFVLPKDVMLAYDDTPLPILNGQTISAPHMVALQTELLEPKKSDVVLEIGSGSGYQAAILSSLVKEVLTIELDSELACFAGENLKAAGVSNVIVINGNGRKGFPKKAPYDKVMVTCACREIEKSWVSQLKERGIIIVPVGGPFGQELIRGIREKEKLKITKHGGCIFVPLRG